MPTHPSVAKSNLHIKPHPHRPPPPPTLASYRQPHNKNMPENKRVKDAMNHKLVPLKAGASLLLSLKPVGPNPELNTDEGGVGIIDEGVPVPVPVPVLVPVPVGVVPVPVGVVPVLGVVVVGVLPVPVL